MAEQGRGVDLSRSTLKRNTNVAAVEFFPSSSLLLRTFEADLVPDDIFGLLRMIQRARTLFIKKSHK
jgi:hypothetical protein